MLARHFYLIIVKYTKYIQFNTEQLHILYVYIIIKLYHINIIGGENAL